MGSTCGLWRPTKADDLPYILPLGFEISPTQSHEVAFKSSMRPLRSPQEECYILVSMCELLRLFIIAFPDPLARGPALF